MPHGAIIGMTTSGKTTLARVMAKGFRDAGIPTLVLHKPREPWNANEATWQTTDPELYLTEFWKRKSHACFMELTDGNVDKFDLRFHKCFSEGRHEGHRCFYLTQRAASVHPTIRENCVSLYLFTVIQKAANLWAEEFCDDTLKTASTLPQHVFLFKENRYTPAIPKRLTIPGKQIHKRG